MLPLRGAFMLLRFSGDFSLRYIISMLFIYISSQITFAALYRPP